ncbi:MAG: hypothetical protein ABSD03_16805 [Vulcanimicrobiaceae bacterium]|jgi:hypothetical protein
MQHSIPRPGTTSVGKALRAAAGAMSGAWARLKASREDNSLVEAVLTDRLERELADRAYKHW